MYWGVIIVKYVLLQLAEFFWFDLVHFGHNFIDKPKQF